VTNPVVAFTREKVREGKLPISIKFYQAIGGLPDSFKTFAFNTFLLLYYTQILGLPGFEVSLVLTLAVTIDAITDPMVGSYSDGLKTKLGRRHLLMYWAIIPLGLCLYFVFSPPQGLSSLALLGWLAFFAIGARIAMTFYVIPWTALFPELSDDYAERSEILTWRYLVGGVGGIGFTLIVWNLIFPASEAFPQGQLNPAAYQPFAIVLSVSVMVSAFLTTWLTQSEVPYLRQPSHSQKFSLVSTLKDLMDSLKNYDFKVLFTGLLAASVVGGTLSALNIFLSTYFWGLTTKDLSWFSLAGFGALLGFAFVSFLQKRFDKKHILVTCMLIQLMNGIAMVSMRFFDILPQNGDPDLLIILVAQESVQAFLGVIVGVMFISMIGDTLDAQDLNTGRRQEGVFSAAISFSNKAISGIGIMAAGALLDFVVKLPSGTAPKDVSHTTILNLGLVSLAVAVMYLIPFWMVTKYTISRQRHADIRAQLTERNATDKAQDM
jgi:glycoside/pentoside/hexuronide:cation symporter, GPH family